MTGLFAALSRGAVIAAAMVFAVGINCLGAQYAYPQGVPDYAALMAASDRSDPTAWPTSVGIRSRS
jgi:hypothetical protein